jgi:endogenous inhibitor of DNA gyrase (YacG/DUF329 family)
LKDTHIRPEDASSSIVDFFRTPTDQSSEEQNSSTETEAISPNQDRVVLNFQSPVLQELTNGDYSYDKYIPTLIKARRLLAEAEADSGRGNGQISCAVCKKEVESSENTEKILFCPTETCTASSHLSCLSGHFVNYERSLEPIMTSQHDQESSAIYSIVTPSEGPETKESDLAILPLRGPCPACGHNHEWMDIVKEYSLRTRMDEKDIEKMIREYERRIQKQSKGVMMSSSEQAEQGDEAIEASAQNNLLPNRARSNGRTKQSKKDKTDDQDREKKGRKPKQKAKDKDLPLGQDIAADAVQVGLLHKGNNLTDTVSGTGRGSGSIEAPIVVDDDSFLPEIGNVVDSLVDVIDIS